MRKYLIISIAVVLFVLMCAVLAGLGGLFARDPSLNAGQRIGLTGVAAVTAMLLFIQVVRSWRRASVNPMLPAAMRAYMQLSVEENPNGNVDVHGRLVGPDAQWYYDHRYKVALYARGDVWYRQPGDDDLLDLTSEYRWQTTNVRRARRYAALLVGPTYAAPVALPREGGRVGDMIPLYPNGTEIVRWAVWSSERSDIAATLPALVRAVHWLMDRLPPYADLPEPRAHRTGLVLSKQIAHDDLHYAEFRSRSWLYDNAYAAVCFVQQSALTEAATILNTLQSLIDDTGALAYSYNLGDDWYHGYYRIGAIAWAGYALVTYAAVMPDAVFLCSAKRLATYLLKHQDQQPASASFGSLGDLSTVKQYATDDNIVAYFFLRDLGRLIQDPLYLEAAGRIKHSLMTNHWNQESGYFRSAIGDATHGLIEVQTMGAFFLLATGQTTACSQLLSAVDATYQPVAAADMDGYAPYEDRVTVWSQATAQVALAYRRMGLYDRYRALVATLTSIQNADGSIPSATPPAWAMHAIEFQGWPDVSSTAWFALAASDDSQFFCA